MPNKVIDNVEWCPDLDTCLLAVANEDYVHLIGPELYRKELNKRTKDMFSEAEKIYKIEAAASDKKEKLCKWSFASGKKEKSEEDADDKQLSHPHILASVIFNNVISRISWHAKGDYLATMAHNV